jgi:hypothetical protein
MFIVIHYGCPHVEDSLEHPVGLNWLAIIRRSWAHCFAFDAQQRYRSVPSREQKISWWQQLLARSFYNPVTDITRRWEPSGGYALAEIVALVEKGLETDDDVIQQWFGADDVMKLLRSATTFDEMVDAVDCICGGFENDPRLQAIVDRVLGPRE